MRFGVTNDCFSIERHELKIQKMGSTVNLTEEVRFQGRLLCCRISYKAGHWYAAFAV